MNKPVLLVRIGAPVSTARKLRIVSNIAPPRVAEPSVGRIVGVGGLGAVSYAITDGSLPPGVTLDGATGELPGTFTTQGYYEAEVTATDSAAATEAVRFSFAVSSGIAVQPSLPQGETDIPYSAQLFANGGTPPYTWTTESGSVLPDGLTFVGDTIAGTPTGDADLLQVTSFLLRATDANGLYSEAQTTITIWPPLSVSGSLPAAFVGVPYGSALTAMWGSGGQKNLPAVRWSTNDSSTQNGLPVGFAIDPITGIVFGTSTEPGSHSLDIVATDEFGAVASQTVVFSVSSGGSGTGLHYRRDDITATTGDDLVTTSSIPFDGSLRISIALAGDDTATLLPRSEYSILTDYLAQLDAPLAAGDRAIVEYWTEEDSPSASTLSSTIVTYTTWNPTDKGAGLALSSGDTVVSQTTGGALAQIVRSVHGKSSGKYYVEVYLDSGGGVSTSDGAGFGIANASATLSNYLGGDAGSEGMGFYGPKGYSLRAAAYQVSNLVPGGIANTDVVQIYIDLDDRFIYAGVNGAILNSGDPLSGGAGTGNVCTIPGPTSYPMFLAAACYHDTSAVTLRNPLSYSYSTPAGYTKGWPT